MLYRNLGVGVLTLAISLPVTAQVRAVVGHFAPFADTVEGTSVTVQVNGAAALENVVFGNFTDYLELGAAGTYAVDIIPTGATDPAISFSAELADGDYTLLAAGDGANQPLQLLALADDNTPPAEGNIKIRVVHAAPFAPAIEDTNVSIRTAGGDVVAGLNPVPFGVASGYLELPAGSYDLKVATPDGATNLIDPLPVDLASGTIATLVATGDGANQAIGIDALPVGELPLRVPVDSTAAGVFYDPATPGQGAQIFSFPRQNRVLGFIYTFDTVGAEQVWYHFDSCNSDAETQSCATPGAFDGLTADITVYRSVGGIFNDPAQATLVEEGVGTISFVTCDEVVISADFGNGQGISTLNYTRLGDRLNCTPALQ